MTAMQLRARAELERRRRLREAPAEKPKREPLPIEADYTMWLGTLYPASVSSPFAQRHHDLWRWIWSMQPDTRPDPFIGIWPRGGGKTTSAELACVAIGAREIRPYIVYMRSTQEKADENVQNIAALLESPRFAAHYPRMASRALSKYGTTKGWRRNRLRTASGFTIDAMGLDSAFRGAKIDENRPGMIILDDIDAHDDSLATTQKKIKTITTSVLPAGSPDLAVLGIQNLIIPNGIFSRMADGRADFLASRIVSGPHKAVDNLVVEQRDGRFVIISGTPTWVGQNLDTCQRQIMDWGYSAFLTEAQQEVDDVKGGMFDHLDFRRCEWRDVPELVRIVVWCDPAVTNTDDSDAHGIQVDGLGIDDRIYRLWSWEDRTSPQDVLRRAIQKAAELGAECVGVETDQGGDTWISVYNEAVRELGIINPPAFRSAKAGQGHGPKAHRAAQMLSDYERGRFVHVIGTHAALERGLKRFPKSKPYDLVDSAYWSWYDLTVGVEEEDQTNSAAFAPVIIGVRRG